MGPLTDAGHPDLLSAIPRRAPPHPSLSSGLERGIVHRALAPRLYLGGAKIPFLALAVIAGALGPLSSSIL
jgi:hypothetical protein